MKKIASILFQMGPVIVGMFAVTLYLILESAFLLYSSMPDYIGHPFFRGLAATFIACGIHLTVLTTAVNAKIISKAFPAIFAVLAALITCFFFGVFDSGKTIEDLAKDILFSAVIGLANFVYVYLFVEKYEQSEINRPFTDRIAELEATLMEAEEVITNTEAEVEKNNQDIVKLKEILEEQRRQFNASLTARNEQLTALQQELDKKRRQHEDLQQRTDEDLTSTQGTLTKSREEVTKLQRQLEEAQQQLHRQTREMEEKFELLQRQATKAEREKQETEKTWNDRIEAIREKRFCPDCHEVFAKPQALSRHAALCEKKKERELIEEQQEKKKRHGVKIVSKQGVEM